MSRFKKISLGLLILLALFTIIGFFILPPIIKSVLTDKLSQTLARPVSIRDIAVNPYLLSVKVQGFEIKERSGTEAFVAFDEFYTSLDVSSIFRKALILREVKLIKPYARILRHEDQTYNFSDLLTKFAGTPKEAEKKNTDPFHFSLNNIQVVGGRLDFTDGPAQTKHQVTDLNLSIPFISNTAYQIDQFTQPALSVKINGTPYAFKGKTKPFSDALETEFNIDIKDLNIPYYMAYVPVKLHFKVPSALFDAQVMLSYRQHRDKKPTLKISGDMALKQLVVDDMKGRSLIKLPLLGVSMASVEPLIPNLHFSKITLTSPDVSVHRGKQGELNLLGMKPEEKQEAQKSPTPKEKKQVKKEPSTLAIRVDEFQIAQGKVTFKDEQPAQPVSLTLQPIDLLVKEFATAKNSKALLDFSVRVDKGGTLSAKGPVGIDPLAADLNVKINQIDLRPFQAYFTDQVKIMITKGSVSAAGKAGITDLGKEKGLSAKYSGNLLLADFNSIDKTHAESLLKWKSLFFNDLRFSSQPLSVHIRQIALADFFARVTVDETGTLNLQNIYEKKKETDKDTPPQKTAEPVKTKEPSKKEASMIKIDTITLQGGTVDFLDRYVKPNYTANLSQIGGRVSGLSSIDEKPADVELRGRFNRHMPLEIVGKVHPFQKDLFVDLKASFKDVDLSPVSPYSGKYVGYIIQKGKLSFDLKYLIAQKKLESENKIFIDQLTLGEPVESPQALKIPIGLAIALLKDRSGEIHLDVPVTGTTDDPDFSIGRLVVQVLVNLITKAVTAPFALLGSLFGGGEELSYVEFDYGRSVVNDTGRKKIEALVKALQERPALKLDIEGHADMERDLEGLKHYRIERKVKALKLSDMIKQGLPAVPLDEVQTDPREYEKYLTQAYRAEAFPKPRNALGMVKTLPVPEMEKLMLTHGGLKGEDIKLLATQRATVVYNQILKSGRVTPERVFIIEPKSVAAQKKDKAKDSRVDFRLK